MENIIFSAFLKESNIFLTTCPKLSPGLNKQTQLSMLLTLILFQDVLEFGITSPAGVLRRLERLSLSLAQKYSAFFLENQVFYFKVHFHWLLSGIL